MCVDRLAFAQESRACPTQGKLSTESDRRWLQARFGVEAINCNRSHLPRFEMCISDGWSGSFAYGYAMMNDMTDAVQIRRGIFCMINHIVISFADMVNRLLRVQESNIQGGCCYKYEQQQYF
jgi:hypothetical protein